MTKQQTMFSTVRAWQRSGTSKSEFARQRGIAIPMFYYWCRRYEESVDVPEAPFIELPLADISDGDLPAHSALAQSAKPREARLRVEFADGLSITIY
jgi:hypothetical protein